MRTVFCALSFTFALVAQQGSIEGLTINSATREPIPGVHVRLVAAGFSGITASYGALSDREGHFSIVSIRPGTYVLAPDKPGFLVYTTKGSGTQVPSLAVRAGQQLTGVTIELAPRAILSGRVVDENGDPVQGVNVSASATDEKDQPNFIIPPPDFPTDDRGEFRISTVAGRYHLQARLNNSDSETRNGVSVPAYRPTFYPSAATKVRATAVDAIGGKETAGLEIRLSRSAGASITGMVRGIPEGGQRPIVYAQWGSTRGTYTAGTSSSADAEGRFTIANPQAAFYRITAFWSGKPTLMSRSVELQVDESGAGNIELTLAPGAEISGTIEVQGDPPESAPKRTVRLESVVSTPMFLQPSGGGTDAKGAFSISGIVPSKYRVRVTALPDDAYVGRLVVDGTEIPDCILDLTRGNPASIKVTVARDAARITGRILDEHGEPINTVAAILFSPVPVPPEPFADMVVRPQPDGSFSINGIRPGKYRIMALDAFRNSGSDSSALMKLLEKAEEIEIAAGARIQKNVRIAAKEDANAKPRQ